MKKTALTILLAASALIANAQSPYDAWLYSENNYEGTARSVAMGNAFTALGGDLGAVSINPAGSAVAGYSQFTLTPSITFSTNTATGAPYDGDKAPYFQDKMRSRMTDFGLSNIGFSFNFDTGRKSGLKSYSLGFIVNRTNSWCEDVYARGTNTETSYLAAMAADAQNHLEYLNRNLAPDDIPYSKEDFLSSYAYDDINLYWSSIVGYRSGMFSSIDPEGQKFAGATEVLYPDGTHGLPVDSEICQTYGRSTSGNKYEYIFNIGANISDFVYLGFNLGINTLTYDMTRYFKEGAYSDKSEFINEFTDKDGVVHTTCFDKAKHTFDYNVDGSGVFAKFGVIVNPGNGFRFGAAVQTPTAMTIRQEWQETGETNFTNSSFDGYKTSPRGENEYTYRSPWRANFGIAYTLGKLAVVSADYEIADFNGMKFKYDRHDMEDADVEYFELMNEDISHLYGSAHYLRVGTEIRPSSNLSLRAGYNFSSPAQKKFYNEADDEYLPLDPTYNHNVSFGLGYNSKKSFFADIACRYTLPQDEYILPYSDYLAETNGALPPEILNRHSNWKVLLTLGWRF